MSDAARLRRADTATVSIQSSTRRRLVGGLALVAAPAVWRGALAQEVVGAEGDGPLPLTPRQTEGPFYPVELPADTDADLLAQGALRYTRGRPVWLEGLLVDPQRRAINGGVVEIWQCDEDGRYRHPGDGDRADPAFQAFGRVQVGADGRFRFRTIRPAPYPGRTPHIHAKVKVGRRELLTTQLYVEGDPGNARDGIWRRLGAAGQAAVTLPYTEVADGLQARCRLVVEA